MATECSFEIRSGTIIQSKTYHANMEVRGQPAIEYLAKLKTPL